MYIYTHTWTIIGKKRFWKTIYFTTVSTIAQLLCLDWMQLKLLTDSLLVKLPFAKG